MRGQTAEKCAESSSCDSAMDECLTQEMAEQLAAKQRKQFCACKLFSQM